MHEVVARPIFHIGPVAVTNHMIMMTIAAALLILFLPLAVRREKNLVPRGWSNAVESVCIFLREEVARPFLGEYADKYIFYIWTLFFFILAMNLLGMTPIDKIIFMLTGGNDIFIGGSAATANIWITGTLAVMAFCVINGSGIKKYGPIGFFRHLVPKVPVFLVPIILVLEIVSMFVKPVALAVRLFANILAGHLLLATLIGLIFVFKNIFVAGASIAIVVAMSLLELFVAFLQAYIFTFLTTIFIGLILSEEH